MDTTLTAEEVQDIVGNMIVSSANQNINVTYNDIANRLEFEVPAANFVDTNHTYDFSSVAITGGVSLKQEPQEVVVQENLKTLLVLLVVTT